MAEDRGRVVWILGAGFSKSLGGPLLPDLLSERARAETIARYAPLAEQAAQVYPLFAKHQKGNARNRGDGGTGLPVYWEHAEEFLDFVDTAANGHLARQAILAKELSGVGFEALRQSCIRMVAAECEIASLVDLRNSKTTPEAWQPYLRWAQAVNERDAVLTFNYDLVLEKLGEAPGMRALGKESVFGVEGYVRGVGVAPIYKLHGSLDWLPTAKPEFFVQAADPRQQIISDKGPLIATPGPSKKLHCTGAFKPIWTQALEALTRAEVVVFVGYRFPPSDAESRTQLLAALRGNQSRSGVRVHTVLGPNTNEGDTIRLRELLRSTLSEKFVEWPDHREAPRPGGFQVIVHPLYAEDFFTVFHSNMLFGHGYN